VEADQIRSGLAEAGPAGTLVGEFTNGHDETS
jgi:hypothetical protein